LAQEKEGKKKISTRDRLKSKTKRTQKEKKERGPSVNDRFREKGRSVSFIKRQQKRKDWGVGGILLNVSKVGQTLAAKRGGEGVGGGGGGGGGGGAGGGVGGGGGGPLI